MKHIDALLAEGDTVAQAQFVSNMLRVPCRSELAKLSPNQMKNIQMIGNVHKPPTLLEFKEWLQDFQIVWKYFIHDYNVVNACFWHNFKNNYLDSACTAALFYLTVC